MNLNKYSILAIDDDPDVLTAVRLLLKPEVKEMESGKKLATFNIATNESYRNAKGKKITETQWHRVVAWGKVAEIAEKYLDKGKEVAIEGKLVNRSYNDKDGNKKYITEVQVSELLLLGAKVTEA